MKPPASVRPRSICELSLLFLRVAFEGVERGFPEFLQGFQLLDRVSHCFASGWGQLVDSFAAVFSRPDQSGPGEQPGMLADCGAADRKPIGEFAGAQRRVGQSTQDLPARRITKRSNGPIQRHGQYVTYRLRIVKSSARVRCQGGTQTDDCFG